MTSYNNSFKTKTLTRPPHQWTDKSHSYSYTDNIGRIVPTLVDRLAPGESFKLRDTTKLWSLPFFAPMFSGMQLKTRNFVVPLRKIVPHWDEWLTSNPSDLLEHIYTTPVDIIRSAFNEVVNNIFDSSLADYLGWPSIIRQWCIVVHGLDLEECTIAWHTINTLQNTQYSDPLAEIRAVITNGLQSNPPEYEADTYYFNGDPGDDVTDAKLYKSILTDVTSMLTMKLSLVPFIAYQKIVSDWLVDMRFQPDFLEALLDYAENSHDVNWHVGSDETFPYTGLDGQDYNYNVLRFLMTTRVIGYAKDYFTTAATEQQRGDSLVIGPSKLPIMFDVTQQGVNPKWPLLGLNESQQYGDSGQVKLVTGRSDSNQSENAQALLGVVWAQVNESDEITPIKLRWQMALQTLLERQNIGGYSRYTAFILGQYGIRVPDPYLQRSVYLGGYSTDINASPVVAQADGTADDGSSILGEVAATGSGFNGSPLLRGTIAHDHVFLMQLSWVVCETYYYQGFRSIFTDLKMLDLPLWEMAGVGEQPVYQKELFLDDKPDSIFGYQKRFSNHRIYHNEIHGEFRGNLQYFHTGRKFLSSPHLGGDFLYQRGSDGHDRVFSIDPKIAAPFRITKAFYYEHKMCL